MNIGRRHALGLVGVAALSACGAVREPAPARALAEDAASALPYAGSSRLVFAGVDEGRRLLAADDDYLPATGGFQRRAMMDRTAPVTLAQFRQWNADAVQPWGEPQRERWRAAALAIEPRVRELRLPLPERVLLVASNGQESARMPYTRANAIVITTSGSTPRETDAYVMAHELWHVVSRHAPTLADRVYRDIGVEPVPALAWPAVWDEIRLTNPDAPVNRHAMRAVVEGRQVWLTPALVAARTALEPGEAFSALFEVRLLEIRPDAAGGRSLPVMGSDGTPRWHRVDSVPSFLERSGGNTDYVIHPEETMADNVAFLLTGQSVRNAELLRRIEAALKG